MTYTTAIKPGFLIVWSTDSLTPLKISHQYKISPWLRIPDFRCIIIIK